MIYYIYGNDDLRVLKKAHAIADEIIPEADREFSLDVIDGNGNNAGEVVDAIHQVITSLKMVNLFGGSKTVWLKDADICSETRTASSILVKDEVEKFLSFLKAGLPEGYNCMITSPSADKRKAFYKFCKKDGEVFEFNIPEPGKKGNQILTENLRSCLSEYCLSCDGRTFEDLKDALGSCDSRKMDSEIFKLSTYLGDSKEFTSKDVQEIITISSDAVIWDLTAALSAKNLKKALNVVSVLIERQESPIGMAIMLGNAIKDLIVFRSAMDAGWLTLNYNNKVTWGAVPQIQIDAWNKTGENPMKFNPYRALILTGQASKFSQQELFRALAAAGDAQKKMVTTSVPADIIIEVMLSKILSGNK
jgi:DNA polymerase III subunit delta